MNSFDQFSKGLANGGMSRRDGLKLAFGGAAFAALSTLGIGTAAAAPASFESLCKGIPGGCGNYHNCGTNPNCFCHPHINKTETFCGCAATCYTPTCASNSDCLDPQTLCTGNSCCGSGGFCVHKCKGQFKNCLLGPVANGASSRTTVA